ncbi:MAG: exodeoxyribonuclease V subunit alpha [Balneolaceae bacterium]|nr:MAG: exodeoxyribonuclease V subunit alpha [Balneolaceae bacterium]
MSKPNVYSWFDEGIKQSWIERYEQEAVRFLKSEFGELTETEILSVVFVSLFNKAGHTALPVHLSPQQWAEWLEIPVEHRAKLPKTSLTEENIGKCRIISRSAQTPLLIEDGLISFQKSRFREKAILQKLASLNSSKSAGLNGVKKKEWLKQLFQQPAEETDWQKTAAALSLIKQFLIVSGGPGTGKTTTVARILALHTKTSEKKLNIALAAPTGKAAGRMGEALNAELQKLGLTDDELQQLPREAKTVHRLLSGTENRGLLPPVDKKLLPYDLFIIDEASMIDLNLMYRLISHVKESATLILLGDKDQLASVEAGSVFADLCSKEKNAFSPETADALFKLGADVTGYITEQSTLDGAIIYLTKSYRFHEESGIGSLAGKVKSGQASKHQLMELFSTSEEIESKPFYFTIADLSQLAAEFADRVKKAENIIEPQHLLAYWKRNSWLTVLRHGLTGSNRLNQLVEEHLAGKRIIRPDNGWYQGRPLIITQNDYNLGVFNGDLGVCLKDEQGNLNVYIETGSRLKKIHPSRLQHFETAYFLTVHKSQGSEFEHVNLLLPQNDTPILTRELLYTAITRARKTFTLYGNPDLFSAAIQRKTVRFTGLERMITGER